MRLFLMLFLAVAGLPAAETLRIPIDVEQQRRFGEELKTAAADGNFATVLLYGRRSLELYPNDPQVQGLIYWVMAEAARRSGDPVQATELANVAVILDSTLPGRTATALGEAAPTTRGEKADRFNVALTILAQGVQSYQQVRTQVQQQRMQRQIQQMQQQGGQQPVAYPQQPPAYPQQNGAAVVYPSAPLGDPMYLPNPGPPQPMPGWPPQGPPQQPQPPSAYYPSGPAPYAAPVGYAPPPVPVRGEKGVIYSLIHDHSVIGDNAYFEHSCGVLVSVSGSNLVLTASGGEAPRVIPSVDIREIRMNTAMGRNEGVFHIATSRGLYLSLAPKSMSREDARATIEDLRSRLGLSE